MSLNLIRDERGFSLVEVLVVIFIIGTLAAIALPSFLGQRSRAQDALAKSNARNVLTHVESCYTPTDDYNACETAESLGGERMGVPIGSNPGQVQVTAQGEGFRIRAFSVSGNLFDIQKANDGVVSRNCTLAPGNPAKGCVDGSW